MPEATGDTHDSLDARAAALVADHGAPPPASAGPQDSGIDLDDLAAQALEQLVAEPAQAVASVEPPAPPPTRDPQLADAAQKLIENGESPRPMSVSSPQPVPDKIESLDAQIATMADNLMAGEPTAVPDDIKGQVGERPVPFAAPVMPVIPAPASKPAPAPMPVPELSIPVAPQSVPAAPPRVALPPRSERAVVPRTIATPTRPTAAPRMRPIGLGVLSVLSGPLRNRPKYVRDVIGWVALVTIFNAACLWMYVLFFRSDKPPVAGPPAAKATAESGHAKTADAHAKDTGHGAPEKKKATKTAAKKPAKKDSKAQASHGGGH